MIQSWKFGLASWLAIGGAIALGGGLSPIAFSGNCAFAQIAPDNTLGSENSQVTSTDAVDTINGGATRGANLLHSFGEFNVKEGRSAYFTNPTGIENILTRVTGANPSNVLGTLGVLGNANLFLINPKGIIFGPNARLDIGGSFVASTASAVNLADGNQFSATAPQTTPLLTISVPIGLQYGANPGKILVQGNGQGIRTNSDLIDTTFGLRVQPNQTLALVGGDLVLEGGTLKTAGGRIELGSVTQEGLVSLTPISKGFALNYDAVPNFGNIQLSQQAAVDASGAGGGEIQVAGRRVALSDGSQIETSTLGADKSGAMVVKATELVEVIGTSADGQFSSGLYAQAAPSATGDAGDLSINTRELLLQDGAQVSARTSGSGKGGNLTVIADKVQVTGITANGQFASALAAQASRNSTGDAGNLKINTGELLIQDGAQVGTATFGAGKGRNLTVIAEKVQVTGIAANGQFPSALAAQASRNSTGDAGNLTINTRQLLVRDGAQVSAGTFGAGKGGDLTVNAADSVQLIGSFAGDQIPIPTGLFTEAVRNATGDAGNLTINTRQLLIQDGAEISSATFGAGKGGDLTVNATDSVQLIGTSIYGQFSSSLTAQANPNSSGDAGNLSINTRQLLVRDGAAVSSTTFGAGKGGDLTVNAADSVQLIGTSIDGQLPSSLAAQARRNSTGDAGDLTINTGELLIQDGAEATVSSLGEGVAGNLGITANSVRLDNGYITAQTRSGNGGNLKLDVADLLLMLRGSEISTTAGRAQQGGDGGNITINAPNGFIVALPDENSDITANAYTGKGGNVQINAFGIYGTQFREKENSQTSDITASSDFGVNGTVELNTPDIDLSSGLVNLPSVPVDTEVAQGCTAGGSQAKSEFIITGRGGLPPNPGEALSTDAVQVNLITFNPEVERPSTTAVSPRPASPKPAPIVEAQGWVIDANGNVVLTANAPTATVTPRSSWQTPTNCSAPKP